MNKKTINNLIFFCFNKFLEHQNITHFITTREGSNKNVYNSLNLAIHIGDDYDKVMGNRKLVAEAFNFSPENYIILNQVHGNNIAVVKKIKGFLEDRSKIIPTSDAVITNLPNFCLTLHVADCVPILFFDPKKKVIGAAHAGWKGTVKQIALLTVQKMSEEFNCDPADIVVGIGPAICGDCYDVGDEVVQEYRNKLPDFVEVIKMKGNKKFVNLKLANKLQLLKAGIKIENIEIAVFCTKKRSDLFFSKRADGRVVGEFMVGMMLK